MPLRREMCARRLPRGSDYTAVRLRRLSVQPHPPTSSGITSAFGSGIGPGPVEHDRTKTCSSGDGREKGLTNLLQLADCWGRRVPFQFVTLIAAVPVLASLSKEAERLGAT